MRRSWFVPALLALISPIASPATAVGHAEDLVPGWPRAVAVDAATDSAGQEHKPWVRAGRTQVAVSPSGRVYATFEDLRHDDDIYDAFSPSDVEMRWSDDGGSTWGPLLNLSETDARVDERSPDVAASPTSAVVVHRAATYADNGEDVTVDLTYTRISADGSRTVNRRPADGQRDLLGEDRLVATGGGYVHLDRGDSAVVSVSTDDGRTFSEPVPVLPDAAYSRDLALAADGDEVSVLLRLVSSDGPLDPRVVHVASRDGGRTWEPPVVVTRGEATGLTVAVAGERTVASWTGQRDGHATLEVAVSQDRGATWSPAAELAALPTDAKDPGWYLPGTGLVATGDGFLVSQPETGSPMLHSSDGFAWSPVALPSRHQRLVHAAGVLYFGERDHAHVHRSGLVPAGGPVRGRIWPANPLTEALPPLPYSSPLTGRATDDACPAETTTPAGFGDVPAESAHRPAIDCVASWGVARGLTDTTFGPAVAVNRGQMATFVVNAMLRSGDERLPQPTKDWFTDDQGSPHEANINRLAEAGIVAGRSPGVYAPTAPVTRGAMAKFLVASYQYTSNQLLEDGVNYFSDALSSPFGRNINAAASQRLVTGYSDGRYRPDDLVRRDQMASFLARWLDLAVEQLWQPLPLTPRRDAY